MAEAIARSWAALVRQSLTWERLGRGVRTPLQPRQEAFGPVGRSILRTTIYAVLSRVVPTATGTPPQIHGPISARSCLTPAM